MTLFNPITGFKTFITNYYTHTNIGSPITAIIFVKTLAEITEEYPDDLTTGIIIINNAVGNTLQRYAGVRDERYVLDIVIGFEDDETTLHKILSEIDRAMGESNEAPAIEEQYELSFDLDTNYTEGVVRALVTIDREAVAIPT